MKFKFLALGLVFLILLVEINLKRVNKVKNNGVHRKGVIGYSKNARKSAMQKYFAQSQKILAKLKKKEAEESKKREENDNHSTDPPSVNTVSVSNNNANSGSKTNRNRRLEKKLKKLVRKANKK